MPDKPTIALTASDTGAGPRPFLDAIQRAGADPWPILARYALTPDEIISRAGALILPDGPPVNPARYGQPADPDAQYDAPRDQMEITLTRAALDADLPIYGICRGMHILNIALGGALTPDIQDHAPTTTDDPDTKPAYHRIYISPGSKLAAVVGSGGFVRVNSLHRLGMREAQKSPHLLASAYSLDDGVIEAVESPNHKWVIAVQFAPHRRMEIPPHFDRLLQSLAERAAETLTASPP